jgi:uncharacterized membrane protein
MDTTPEQSQLGLDGLGKKVYKDNAIFLGAFLGGPLAAGYLMSENYKTFQDFPKARKTLIISMVATLVLFALAYWISELVHIPSITVTIVYCLGIFQLAKYYQGAQIKSVIDSGGEYHKWGRVIAISLIALAATLVVLFALSFAYFAYTGVQAQ